MSPAPLFRRRRVAVEGAIALLWGLILFVLGFTVAGLVVASLPQGQGVRWITTGPTDLLFVKLKLGAVAASAALVSFVAQQLDRLGGRADVGWRASLVYLLVPPLALTFGVGAQVGSLHGVAAIDPGGGSPYMVALREVVPGAFGKNLLVVASLLLWGAAFGGARVRRKSQRQAAAEPTKADLPVRAPEGAKPALDRESAAATEEDATQER